MAGDEQGKATEGSWNWVLFVAIGVVIGGAALYLGVWLTGSETRFGPLGDSMAPVAAVLSFLAIMAALRSVELQRRELALQREELRLTRAELKEQAEHLKDAAAAQNRLAAAQEKLAAATERTATLNEQLVDAQNRVADIQNTTNKQTEALLHAQVLQTYAAAEIAYFQAFAGLDAAHSKQLLGVYQQQVDCGHRGNRVFEV
jgi:hypothetical protein